MLSATRRILLGLGGLGFTAALGRELAGQYKPEYPTPSQKKVFDAIETIDQCQVSDPSTTQKDISSAVVANMKQQGATHVNSVFYPWSGITTAKIPGRTLPLFDVYLQAGPSHNIHVGSTRDNPLSVGIRRS